ncbi:MAG: hypothetical protein H6838_04445 [Planctomycetes bacterium]|nr:hypothetical protein [Planctomycetota bacterium]MCB9884716.1 hypothetical protein [Planctomycetota bacterium]
MLLFALLAACASTSVINESEVYSRRGNYLLAFDLLEKERQRLAAEHQEPSQEFLAAYRQAEIGFAVYQARRAIFEEHEEDALVLLDNALAVGADPAEVDRLRKRATHKLAVRATEVGNEHLVKGELEEALASFLQALSRQSDYELAHEGAEKVRAAVLMLTERAQQQFLEGVRKLPEFRYVEVQWHAMNAVTNDASREDAKELASRAQKEILEQRFARAKEMQDADMFGAAMLEYLAVRRVDPGFPGVDDAIESMKREVEAARLVGKAKVDMRMERFDEAQQGLEDALKKSEFSRAGIGELMMQCRNLRGEHAYQKARDLEILGKKAEALAAFEAIRSDFPDGLRDEAARADALRIDVDGAKTEWDAAVAAEAAGNLAEALEHYKAAERYYPGWQDGKDRIAKIEAKLSAASGGAEGTSSGKPDGRP